MELNQEEVRPAINLALFLVVVLSVTYSGLSWSAGFQSYNASISAFNNSNVGFARSRDLNEQGIKADISGQSYFEGTPGSGVFTSSSIAAIAYAEYPGLNSVEARVQLGYAKKLGLGFNQPRISAALNLGYNYSDSKIRVGWSIAPSLNYSKNISNRLSVSATVQYFNFEASDRIAVDPNSPGFLDGEDEPTSIQNSRFNLATEWAWTPQTYLGLDISYLSGEFNSAALPNAGIASFSNAVSVDDGLGSGYRLYRYDGDGYVLGTQIIRTLSSSQELILRLQRSIVDADGGVGYGQTIVNLSFSKSF